MRVLVTGASSLLGRRTVERLVERGDEVTVFQRRPSGLDVRERLGDIADGGAVDVAVAGHDAVIHLAAKVAPTGPWDEFERVNIGGTVNVLRSLGHHDVQRCVHVSTPSVAHHGNPLVGAPAEPADPRAVRGNYATSKAQAEVFVTLAGRHGAPVVALRPHLVWGPGDEQLVGRIVERARTGRLALVGSGNALIDTTYVDNAADALVAALDRAPDLRGEAYVVSNGEPRTVAEIVHRMVAAAGVDVTARRVPTSLALLAGCVFEKVWERRGRTDDPPITSFVAEQLSTAHWFAQAETRAALGWSPAVSLDEGFTRLANHYRTI